MGKLDLSELPKMKKKLAPSATGGSRHVALPTALCALVLGLDLSYGQSAQIFRTEASVESTSIGAVQEQLPEAAPVDTQPSRFAGEDIEAYIRARAAIFSMRNRETDPFGLNQDPNVKPVVNRIIGNRPSRQPALPPTPLTEIVRQINVTTIIPGENKFLVGVRAFSTNHEFSVRYNGKTLQLKVMEVTAQKITFKNMETGETGVLTTEVLPPGMSAGGKNIRPPGVISNSDNVPLDLGSGGAINPEN